MGHLLVSPKGSDLEKNEVDQSIRGISLRAKPSVYFSESSVHSNMTSIQQAVGKGLWAMMVIEHRGPPMWPAYRLPLLAQFLKLNFKYA